MKIAIFEDKECNREIKTIGNNYFYNLPFLNSDKRDIKSTRLFIKNMEEFLNRVYLIDTSEKDAYITYSLDNENFYPNLEFGELQPNEVKDIYIKQDLPVILDNINNPVIASFTIEFSVYW